MTVEKMAPHMASVARHSSVVRKAATRRLRTLHLTERAGRTAPGGAAICLRCPQTFLENTVTVIALAERTIVNQGAAPCRKAMCVNTRCRLQRGDSGLVLLSKALRQHPAPASLSNGQRSSTIDAATRAERIAAIFSMRESSGCHDWPAVKRVCKRCGKACGGRFPTVMRSLMLRRSACS